KGRPLPGPLRWWYRRGGLRPGVLDGQNSLIGPDRLEVEADGKMTFYAENQGIYIWATLPEGDDPPVWGQFQGFEPWAEEEVTLSGFLIQACLFEAILHA